MPAGDRDQKSDARRQIRNCERKRPCLVIWRRGPQRRPGTPARNGCRPSRIEADGRAERTQRQTNMDPNSDATTDALQMKARSTYNAPGSQTNHIDQLGHSLSGQVGLTLELNLNMLSWPGPHPRATGTSICTLYTPICVLVVGLEISQ